jgi:hypothetical protein
MISRLGHSHGKHGLEQQHPDLREDRKRKRVYLRSSKAIRGRLQ